MDRIQHRQEVAKKNTEALLAIDQKEIDAMVEAIAAAKRIYVAGWGRAGNVIKLMSMNCSQLGLKTFVVGDNSTPSIHEGDLLIIGSGSGETDTMKILAAQAKEHGATLALVSGHPESTMGKLADLNIKVPASFYQVVPMLNDCIMSQLADKLGVTFADVMYNHNNLE